MSRILIVDDEPHLRLALRRMLVRLGHLVIEAATGPEAVDAMKAGGIDMVMLDASLDGMDGVQTLKAMREVEPGIRVIAMSGGGRKALALFDQVGKRLGVAPILEKPFTGLELSMMVSATLGQAQLETDMQQVRKLAG